MVNVLQGLGAQQIKELADGLGDETTTKDKDGRDVTTFTPTTESELVRSALQGIAGCAAGAAGGSGDCGSAALGSASSVAVNLLIKSLENNKDEAIYDADGNLLNADTAGDLQHSKNVTALIGLIAEGLGLDPNAASTAGQIETENNQLCSPGRAGCPSSLPRTTWGEARALQAGNTDGYWELRVEEGDPLAKLALEFGMDPEDMSPETRIAYNILYNAVVDKYQEYIVVMADGIAHRVPHPPLTDAQKEKVLSDIAAYRLDLAKAHAQAVNNDTRGIPGLLSPKQVAQYHWDVLSKYGLPRTAFAGTPVTGTWIDFKFTAPLTTYLPSVWCNGCDSDD